MRSILLATLEYPTQKGGIATYLANVVACFPKGSVHVLAPEDESAHSVDMKSDAVIYRRNLLSTWLRPRWIAAWYWTDWVARREKADMLIVSHLLPMGQVARKLHKSRNLPYVVIVHGMDVALAMQSEMKAWHAKDILSHAQMVIANSSHTAELAKKAGAVNVKIVRPSPGFALDTVVPSDRLATVKKFYNWPDGFVLLSLGRLVERKGFAEVIEAIHILKERGRTVRLVIAGDGPERAKLEELVAKLHIKDRVTFVGKVPDEDLPGLYAACDAFVLAPKTIGADVEGFGIVYLEANLMGKAVIGTRVGGVEDAVIHEKTGLLVEPANPGAIADATVRLMDDKALAARLGADGHARVLAEFGWQKQSCDVIAALTEPVKEKV